MSGIFLLNKLGNSNILQDVRVFQSELVEAEMAEFV